MMNRGQTVFSFKVKTGKFNLKINKIYMEMIKEVVALLFLFLNVHQGNWKNVFESQKCANKVDLGWFWGLKDSCGEYMVD